jgi:hypothetical protein
MVLRCKFTFGILYGGEKFARHRKLNHVVALEWRDKGFSSNLVPASLILRRLLSHRF